MPSSAAGTPSAQGGTSQNAGQVPNQGSTPFFPIPFPTGASNGLTPQPASSPAPGSLNQSNQQAPTPKDFGQLYKATFSPAPYSAQNLSGTPQAGSSPFPFLSTSGNTPNFPLSFTSIPTNLTQSLNQSLAPGSQNLNQLSQLSSQVGGQGRALTSILGGGKSGNKGGIDEVLRGMREAENLLERSKVVLQQIEDLEEKVFTPYKDAKEEDGGMVVDQNVQIGQNGHNGMNGVSQLEVLHLEYTQLLTSLIDLSTITSFGSLPVPLSAASPASTSTDMEIKNSNDPTGATPSIEELTTWVEDRAALEFKRREAVKFASLGVVSALEQSNKR